MLNRRQMLSVPVGAVVVAAGITGPVRAALPALAAKHERDLLSLRHTRGLDDAAVDALDARAEDSLRALLDGLRPGGAEGAETALRCVRIARHYVGFELQGASAWSDDRDLALLEAVERWLAGQVEGAVR